MTSTAATHAHLNAATPTDLQDTYRPMKHLQTMEHLQTYVTPADPVPG